MYEQHFGFSRPLFSDGMAQNETVFRTASISQLVQDLEIALRRKDSVAVLSGVSGTGKSTIAADALKNISTRLAFTCISHPPLTADEFLEQLLTDFGFEPANTSRVERLQQWRQFLSEMAATETRVSLLIESADEFSADVLHQLHSLTAADAALSPGANIVLTTNQPPERLLTSKDTLAFNQRVRLRQRIEPLTATETRDYLAFKCNAGGRAMEEVFEDGLASRLFDLSDGIFRVIDNLLESALMSAAAANETIVSIDRLRQIAEQQFGISQMAPENVVDLLEEPRGEPVDVPDDLDEIPTLTDFVILQDIGRTADGQTGT